MRKLLFALLFLAPLGAQAQSLNDKYVLSQDGGFLSRVRTGIIAAAVAISNEGSGVALHASRGALAAAVLAAPDQWKASFAATSATDAAVASDATAAGTVVLVPDSCTGNATSGPPACTGGTHVGNLAVQAALATDAHINTAISAEWNAFFAH